MRVADLEELLSAVGDERLALRAASPLCWPRPLAAFDFERGLAVRTRRQHPCPRGSEMTKCSPSCCSCSGSSTRAVRARGV